MVRAELVSEERYTFSCPTEAFVREQAHSVIHSFSSRGITVACAESLTAGLLSATLATVPGASSVLRGGVIVYATELKQTLGGVPADVLDADGAVAPTTARCLASHVRRECDATVGVSLTGVAGPKTQEGKTVGTVFVGIADSVGSYSELAGQVLFRHNHGDELMTVEPLLSGDREAIRRMSVSAALYACIDWCASIRSR
ncbi:nicotinamide-nucleotide amidohydrolase family protein [Corynebacterium sp. PCR 32]|uniref:nicotinamide-nucleotide amidohydrolase family protein n=1 Tax=Corynebacterium sp. PCR 32 TaxID=3351342 RepID=UPI00375166D8